MGRPDCRRAWQIRGRASPWVMVSGVRQWAASSSRERKSAAPWARIFMGDLQGCDAVIIPARGREGKCNDPQEREKKLAGSLKCVIII